MTTNDQLTRTLKKLWGFITDVPDRKPVFIPDRTPTLVVLTGRAGAGKSTVADIMGDRRYRQVNIADQVKSLAVEIELPEQLVTTDGRPAGTLAECVERNGWWVTKWTVKGVRELLQSLGDGARRVLGEDVWIDQAIVDVNLWLALNRSVVVTDARYPNEVKKLKEIGAIHVHVLSQAPKPADQSIYNHESEKLARTLDRVVADPDDEVALNWLGWAGLGRPDFVINNPGNSIGPLTDLVENLLTEPAFNPDGN